MSRFLPAKYRTDRRSERSGISRTTLSRLERGLTEPTPKTLLALSLALDITVDDLLDGAAA